MKKIFYFHANKASTRKFYKKGLGLILKVRVFETQKRPIYNNNWTSKTKILISVFHNITCIFLHCLYISSNVDIYFIF